jgi:hypothetical protein
MKTEKEEEMKTENMEGTESTENVSSRAVSGEISEEVASTQKRTTACLNSAQAVSRGVAKGVDNDSKQAITLHLAARGLIENISTRATSI